MNVLFITLGCKVNQYETQSIREQFEAAGYQTTAEDSAAADIVIINSCTVTAESDRKTRQLTRKYRKRFPEAVIVLIGCMAQAFPKQAQALDAADVILGNRDAALVLGKTEEYLKTGVRIVQVEKHERGEAFNTPSIARFEERTRAFMKIEDGCQRYCTYCIIPTARGMVRSKALDDIRREAEELAAGGYKEIVLVGINLSAYGLGCDRNLCDAVETVCGVDGIQRVRLGSLEPDQLSNEDLARLAAQPKFCPQFHLSLQSGCDATLKRMNRHYDTAFYTDLVTRIRKSFDNASITTDIMVGFAGETAEDFETSVQYLRDTGFARSHVFAYSIREGTRAATMPDQVDGGEKARRAEIMGKAARDAEQAFLQSQVGLTCPVLFERCKDGVLEGYTKNYTLVRAVGRADLCGEITDVRLSEALDTFCIGELV